MAQGKTCSMFGIRLGTEGEIGASEKVEDKADEVADGHGNILA